MDGEPSLLTVKANAIVRVPLLEVQGVLEGLEDQPIPLLSQLEGVINAQLRGNGAGQTLELELTNLPEGSQLVKSERPTPMTQSVRRSRPLSIAMMREKTQSLRLPIHPVEQCVLAGTSRSIWCLQLPSSSLQRWQQWKNVEQRTQRSAGTDNGRK